MKNTLKAIAVQKDACTNMQHSTALNITLLISTVSATFVGAKYFGISVPVVGQLPLIIYVALRSGSRTRVPYKSPVLWFAITAAFSSLISLFLPYWNLDGYVSGNIAFFITCTAVAIPLIIAIYNLPDGYRSLRWALSWGPCRGLSGWHTLRIPDPPWPLSRQICVWSKGQPVSAQIHVYLLEFQLQSSVIPLSYPSAFSSALLTLCTAVMAANGPTVLTNSVLPME